MTKLNLLAATIVGLSTLTAIPANAQTSVSVSTSEFNLADAKGQRALDARLRVAVRDVCGVTPPVRDLRDVRSHRQCVINARASVLEQRAAAIASAKQQDAARMAVAQAKGDQG